MRRRHKANALLIDFDGVLRQWDRPANPRHDEFLAAGLSWKLYVPAVTGVWTRAQWIDAIAAETGATAGELSDWESYRGFIDDKVLALVREVRAAGRPVALCTNATDDLRDDLALLGVSDAFDAVVSSSEIGVHKPSREFFDAACGALGVPAKWCLFVDDTHRNVEGARAAGLSAMRWTSDADIPYVRAALDL
ncbi:HAD-IA family hydrolase [Catelliglobosispora koreensis]|uniref:HAD-IA family hydrolase n=1 Tax=Catelliglobosispora koreensis TaxID=129052 RepID=UPI0003767CB0|nr:HAD-IA family hydrolase [Catelliglobosispora koreensis]